MYQLLTLFVSTHNQIGCVGTIEVILSDWRNTDEGLSENLKSSACLISTTELQHREILLALTNYKLLITF